MIVLFYTVACYFAANAHKRQKRKDATGTPYINHPIDVANILADAGITDPDILCAAVLHDTIEDTYVTYDLIKEQFGEKVANIVKECSDDKSYPKEIRKQMQLKHSTNASVEAKLVKAGDKLSNIGDLDSNPPANWTQDEIQGYITWCYAVCLEIKGHNQIVDQRLSDIFTKWNLVDLTPEELQKRLDKYYGNIKNSD